MVTAEQVCISSLTLLKTSKHGHPRVSMEVKGLTFQEFADDGTISMTVLQAGTVSGVKLVGPMFQTTMSDMLKQTEIQSRLLVGTQSP